MANKSITKAQHFPPVLEDWARSAKRHPLDPHLEDVQAVLDQGNPDPAEDKSFRGVILPPSEESGGRSRLAIISARPGHARAIVEEMATGNLYVESVEIERPAREGLERVLSGMREMVALPAPREVESVPMCSGCHHHAHDDHCAVALGPNQRCPCGRPMMDVRTFRMPDVASPAPARAKVADEAPSWTVDDPFTLSIRRGREVVFGLGPFATVTRAWDAMQARGEPGQEATIYERGKVAHYRGGRAVFSFGRTRWSRAI